MKYNRIKLSYPILLLACLLFATQTLAFVHSYGEEHLHENEYGECNSPLHNLDGEFSVNISAISQTREPNICNIAVIAEPVTLTSFYLTIRDPPRPSL